MQELPLCPNCGTDISSYFDLYVALRDKKVQESIKKEDAHIDTIDVIENRNISFEDEFEQMGFIKLCCRPHLTCAVNFYGYLESPS